MAVSKRSLYPPEDWIALLRACLIPGRNGRDAWYRWLAFVDDPLVLMSGAWAGAKRWWPLLWTALQRHRLPVPRALEFALKSAYAAEMVRHAYCLRIAGKVLSNLNSAGFDPVLLKGMALAETVYAQPALRHCHQLDVLIRNGHLSDAAEAVGPDFKLAEAGAHRSHVGLVHGSGLPLRINARSGVAWLDSSPTVVLVTSARFECEILPPEYTLCQVCAEAGQVADFPFDWISDGWHLINSSESVKLGFLSMIAVRGDAAESLCEKFDYLEQLVEEI